MAEGPKFGNTSEPKTRPVDLYDVNKLHKWEKRVVAVGVLGFGVLSLRELYSYALGGDANLWPVIVMLALGGYLLTGNDLPQEVKPSIADSRADKNDIGW